MTAFGALALPFLAGSWSVVSIGRSIVALSAVCGTGGVGGGKAPKVTAKAMSTEISAETAAWSPSKMCMEAVYPVR